MRTFLIICLSIFSIILVLVAFPDGGVALLLVGGLAILAGIMIRRYSDDSEFLIQLFLGALLVRMCLMLMINVFDLYDFFGPDARAYDVWGYKLSEIWQGKQASLIGNSGQNLTAESSSGWGMIYLIGGIYYIFGRSMLVAQSFCTVFSAATVPMIYFCAKQIYANQRVARVAAVLVAFFPAMIIWSSQLLKDGLILLLLVTAMTMVLQLQKKLSLPAIAFLVASLFGLLSLRFYVFYMAAAAAAGSFLVGTSSTTQSLIRRMVAVLVVGTALAYFGVLRNASADISAYGSLERIEVSRQYAAGVADSGFGEGTVKLNTMVGLLTVVPVGFVYLMFAPFPWQVTNFRQTITLPEVFLWWAMIPFIFYGIWYTLKNRFRAAIPVLIFTFLLSVSYSLYQGNVGTAYRQRTQIQVFLFMFISVGWSLLMEKREDRRLLERHRRERNMISEVRTATQNFN